MTEKGLEENVFIQIYNLVDKVTFTNVRKFDASRPYLVPLHFERNVTNILSVIELL